MRLRHADGTLVHLAYNAGVHPAEDLENLIAAGERGWLTRLTGPTVSVI